jgi:hypothetical protein
MTVEEEKLLKETIEVLGPFAKGANSLTFLPDNSAAKHVIYHIEGVDITLADLRKAAELLKKLKCLA